MLLLYLSPLQLTCLPTFNFIFLSISFKTFQNTVWVFYCVLYLAWPQGCLALAYNTLSSNRCLKCAMPRWGRQRCSRHAQTTLNGFSVRQSTRVHETDSLNLATNRRRLQWPSNRHWPLHSLTTDHAWPLGHRLYKQFTAKRPFFVTSILFVNVAVISHCCRYTRWLVIVRPSLLGGRTSK